MLVAGFKAFNLATVGGAGSPWTANPAGSSKARKLQIFEALAELRFQTNLFDVCHGETSRRKFPARGQIRLAKCTVPSIPAFPI